MHPKIDIFMAVHDGEPWLADVLDSVRSQDYPNVRLTVWDNASTDATRDIVARYPNTRLVTHDRNFGFWFAMERLIESSDAPFVMCLTDVVMDRRFVSEAIAAMENDPAVGAVQGKLLEHHRGADGAWVRSGHIDSLGFRLQPSRRVTILGHGEPDDGRADAPRDVLGVEGAAPVFRRSALDDCAMPTGDGGVFRVSDPAFRVGGITYGDDFDLAWRMTLFGWRQVLVPTSVGWHDRSTTKRPGRSIRDKVSRRHLRASIALPKRRLDWSNVRFAIIKNDSIMNILRDIPRIIARETAVMGYTLLFEPAVLAESGRFFRLLPLMLRRRRQVQSQARLTASEFRRFIR